MYELYVYMAQSFKKVVVSVLRGQTVFETFIYRAYFKASQKWSLFDMRSLSNGTKGQLISKGLFAILQFFQKMNESIRS